MLEIYCCVSNHAVSWLCFSGWCSGVECLHHSLPEAVFIQRRQQMVQRDQTHQSPNPVPLSLLWVTLQPHQKPHTNTHFHHALCIHIWHQANPNIHMHFCAWMQMPLDTQSLLWNASLHKCDPGNWDLYIIWKLNK